MFLSRHGICIPIHTEKGANKSECQRASMAALPIEARWHSSPPPLSARGSRGRCMCMSVRRPSVCAWCGCLSDEPTATCTAHQSIIPIGMYVRASQRARRGDRRPRGERRAASERKLERRPPSAQFDAHDACTTHACACAPRCPSASSGAPRHRGTLSLSLSLCGFRRPPTVAQITSRCAPRGPPDHTHTHTTKPNPHTCHTCHTRHTT